MLQRLVMETAKSGFEPMFAATNRVKAAGHARRAVFPMAYQKEALSYVLREDEDTGCEAASYGSAAMVFEEAARLSYELGH